MKKWWIGCSGFYYKSWRDRFYPPGLPQRKWFEYYCEHFNTVELNVSFYRLPKPEVLKGWYDKKPCRIPVCCKSATHYYAFQAIS